VQLIVQYKRDDRSPTPLNENVSKVMSSNRSKNTKPEKLLRQGLCSDGIRGYRLNWKKVPGKPDIAFPGRKIAIFVNGCYWHRCPICDLALPKTNKEFWKEKFEKNIARDKMSTKRLIDLGWVALTIWECEINADAMECVKKIRKIL